MAVDQNQPGRRPHYHRGRRGPDRRGTDRRATATHETPARTADQVDVEQIMRDIRARIAQRSGVELSTQQIQELAARRLEAILDPRNVNPSLMQQLRRGAAAPPDVPAPSAEPAYAFEAETIYESHRGLLRFIRKLLNPLLKLFFNPTPLIHALHTQARLNREAAAREAERERVQMEWNALHYEVVQRLVTEVSRVSLEMQALALRVEALAARVDFNDRRVRTLEAGTPQGAPRAAARPAEPPLVSAASPAPSETMPAETAAADAPSAEGPRRRRRRRRGRRGGAAADAATTVVVGGSEGLTGPDTAELGDGDETDDEEGGVGAPAEGIASGPERPEPPRREPRHDFEAPAAADSGAATSVAPSAAEPAPAHIPVGSETPVAHDTTAEEPHFPVREGLAQGAPPPPPLEPVRAAQEPAATQPSAADPAATAPPATQPAQPTPPPDEPTSQPVPRDPGPPDR